MGRRIRLSPVRPRPTPQPVKVVRAHPLALSYALRLARGDNRRLVLNRDGSVLVLNSPRRTS